MVEKEFIIGADLLYDGRTKAFHYRDLKPSLSSPSFFIFPYKPLG